MTDAGTLTLIGTNTYTGGTNLNGGIVNVGVARDRGHFGPLGTSGPINFAGGTLQYSASNQYDYSSRFSYAANQPYSIDTNGQTVTFATALGSAGGTLTKLGGGTLILANNNAYSGGTTVSGGTLQIGNGGAIGSIASPTVSLNNGATVAFSRFDALAYAGAISGNGNVQQIGTGTTTLSGSNTYSGTTTVDAGTLQFAQEAALYNNTSAKLDRRKHHGRPRGHARPERRRHRRVHYRRPRHPAGTAQPPGHEQRQPSGSTAARSWAWTPPTPRRQLRLQRHHRQSQRREQRARPGETRHGHADPLRRQHLHRPHDHQRRHPGPRQPECNPKQHADDDRRHRRAR